MNSCLRKCILILLIVFMFACAGFADVIDLRGTWLFHQGDDSAWSEIDFPDSSWEYIGVPQIWETAGYANYNGYAWYRKTILIPESWQMDKYVQLQQVLFLELGLMDDVDQTYFNNNIIGQTGSFPPAFLPPQKTLRQYKIPLDMVRWGAENLIAIRVYDSDENGGFYGGKPRLRTPSLVDECSVALKLDQPEHVYRMGEPIFASVSIENNSTEKFVANLDFTLKSINGAIVENLQQEVEVLPGKMKKTRFRFRARIPDYYQLWLRILQAEEELYETHTNLGYNLERLNAATTAEDDFADFWARTQEQLALIPVQASIERIDTLEIPGRHVFRVRLLSFDDVYIYGWYLVPKGRGNFPTILNIQNQPFEFDSQFESLFPNFALFLLDVRGFGNSRAEINPGNPGYLLWNITNKEKYFCRGAIMDCIRAVDFLTSRSEVDTSRLGIFGNGLGGGLALATAALDSRVKVVVVDSPLLMAYEVVNRLTALPYHEIVQYLIEHPSEKKEVFKTLSYFDLINLAPSIQAPVLMSVMLADRISPPISATVVYNRIQGTKLQKFYPFAGHRFTSTAHESMQAEWFKQHLKVE